MSIGRCGHKLVAVMAILPMCLWIWGCKPQVLQSFWLSPSSVVQGNPDWWNLPGYRLENPSGIISITNDSSAMYIRLFSGSKHFARRLDMQGMMLWLTNPESKTERLGIHYPLGLAEGRMPPDQVHNSQVDTAGSLLKVRNDEFEIMYGDTGAHEMKSGDEVEKMGLRAYLVETQEDAAEYTLRVMLGQSLPWIKPGSRIMLEVESAAMDQSKFREKRRSEDAEPKGEMPPRNGRGPGRRGMHGDQQEGKDRKSEGFSPDKPIHFMFLIELASHPPSS